jgi:regulator of sigma E protease
MMVFTVTIAIFVLGVLIFVHELGHFLAAKLVGIQVLRFSIGFGKPIVSRYWGETQYSLSWVPFGGYVKMAGDDPAEGIEGTVDQERVSTDPARHFENKGVLQRFLVISAGPLANFLLAMFLYQGIIFFKGADTFSTTTVETLEQEMILPGMEKIQDGSKVLKVNGIEVSNWDGIVDEVLDGFGSATSFVLQAQESNQQYSLSVPTANDSLRRQLVAALVPFSLPRVGSIVPGKPAQKAGLERGDLIVEINGSLVRSWHEMTEKIHASAGVPLTLLVERGEERIQIEVTPQQRSVPQADGSFKEMGLIGITQYFDRVPLPLGESIVAGARNTVYMTVFIMKSLTNLFIGLITRHISFGEARDVFGGPVLIGQLAGESARSGYLWNFMAILSINLAILNLLPIPVLDGGHLLFLLIEVVRFGRPLSPAQRMRLIQVGLLIVFGLMLLATANDLRRVFGL